MKSILTKACTIRVANFEGPFDLLFHLIEKNKIDIYDIPISDITDQYMEYLFSMQKLNLEIASEFLVMAATLLHIKSALLLPSKKDKSDNVEEVDPRDELVERLIEYKKYKLSSEVFKNREKMWHGFYYKKPENITPEKQYKPIDITIYELAFLYKDIIERKIEKQQKQNEVKELVRAERVTIKDKLRQVINYLKKKAAFKFSELFNLTINAKDEVVTGFIAILELAKLKKVFISQQFQFDDITVRRKCKIDELNILIFNEVAATTDNIETLN